MDHPRSQFPRKLTPTHAAMRGFTIIELLVVTAIIILLLSILIVAVNAATRTAQKSRTATLMQEIKKGLIRFKEDVGYYPPVLGPTNTTLRDLFVPPLPTSGTYATTIQTWWSSCTLADYLIGYGNHREDGYGATSTPNDWISETPALGIRHPGPDGVWGATNVSPAGLLTNRMKWQTGPAAFSYGTTTSPFSIDQGKILGPYFEMKDERLLAGVYYGANGLQTFFPGDALPAGQTWDTLPKAIVDYWGMPIRYYRRPYPPGALGQSYRAVNGQRVPTLSDVYVLRPQSVKPGSESVSPHADAAGNAVSSRELDAAEFALLSAGPDKRINDGTTLAPENVDNIVEIGP